MPRVRCARVTKARQTDESRFVRRTLIAVGIAAAAFLAWELRGVLALVFGAVLIATIIRAIGKPLQDYLKLPERLAVMTAVLIIVGAIGLTIWLIGSQVVAQSHSLADTLPRAAQVVDQNLAGLGLGQPVQSWMNGPHTSGEAIGNNLTRFVSSLTLTIGSFLIVFFGGIFIAAQPRLYGIGLIKLLPASKREVVAEALAESGRALRLWLKGQLIAMVLIFLMTWLGLWLLGVEPSLVLALISGMLEFIPYAGAITSAIPAIMVALVSGPELALYTVGLYILVHHVEAYLIQPVVQQFAVEIPAVLTLFALLAFGLLFGFVGILLAAPLAVVTYVLVKRLYVIEALDTPTPIPGGKSS